MSHTDSEDEEDDFIIKIVVIGDYKVGKSALIRRYVEDEFSLQYVETVGIDFKLKKMQIGANREISVSFWDIMGQDRYRKLTRPIYSGAAGCVVVFDAAQTSTLDGAEKWKEDLDSKTADDDGSVLPAILLGNKCDLLTEDVDPSPLQRFCVEHSFLKHFLVSAKDNINVDEAIRYLISEILKRTGTTNFVQDKEGFDLNSRGQSAEKEGSGRWVGGCC